MTQATDSQLAMWRGAIALAWADGKLDAREKARLLEYFRDNVYLSDAQRTQLTRDLERGVQIKDVWDAITDKEDRAYLIDIAPTIFWEGGAYTPAEHELYDKIFAQQMSTVDIEKVKKDMHAIAARIPEEMARDEKIYENEMEKAGPIIGTAGKLIYHFEKKLGLE